MYYTCAAQPLHDTTKGTVIVIATKYFDEDRCLSMSTLKDTVRFSAEKWNEHVLYSYKDAGEIKSMTYRRVSTCVDELGTAFSVLGIMGERIAVIGDASPYYMPAYFAAANGGGTAVPLDKELDDGAICGFATIANVKAIVYTASFNKRMPTIAQSLPQVRYFIPIKPDEGFVSDERFRSLETLLELGREALDKGNVTFTSFTPEPDSMASLIFTSGTTGTSKGVMLSHKNLITSMNACRAVVRFNKKSRFVSVLPMNHSYEVTCEHLALMTLGCSTYLNESVKYALRNFRTVRPNSLILVPLFAETIHKQIWKEIKKKGAEQKVRSAMALSEKLLKHGIDLRHLLFKSIRAALGGKINNIICGGAALSPEITRDFCAWGIIIQEGYGITECSPLVAVNPYSRVRPGSVGPAVPGCRVRIKAPDDKGDGEILVKGDNVMLGYYNAPDATAEVMTEDGWFRTGDLGHIDSDGFIYVTGRKKNLIILSNGKNVFPEELEEHLYHESIIKECVVIGREDDTGSIAITAVVYPDPELTEGMDAEAVYEKVKDAVTNTNKRLPIFKHIQNFEIRNTEFEKTTTQKIKRYLVK